MWWRCFAMIFALHCCPDNAGRETLLASTNLWSWSLRGETWRTVCHWLRPELASTPVSVSPGSAPSSCSLPSTPSSSPPEISTPAQPSGTTPQVLGFQSRGLLCRSSSHRRGGAAVDSAQNGLVIEQFTVLFWWHERSGDSSKAQIIACQRRVETQFCFLMSSEVSWSRWVITGGRGGSSNVWGGRRRRGWTCALRRLSNLQSTRYLPSASIINTISIYTTQISGRVVRLLENDYFPK